MTRDTTTFPLTWVKCLEQIFQFFKRVCFCHLMSAKGYMYVYVLGVCACMLGMHECVERRGCARACARACARLVTFDPHATTQFSNAYHQFA